MIKVAYVLTPVEFGGAERVNLTFLKNADRTRFQVSPILFVRPWEKHNLFVQRLEECGYAFHPIPAAIKPRSDGRDYFRWFRCLRKLGQIVSQNRFDLMHTHGYFADVVGLPVSKGLHIPHLSTCHGFISNDWNLILYNHLDRFALKFCDRIIAVSEEIRKDLLKKGIKETRIGVVQNAVEGPDRGFDLEENRSRVRKSLGIGSQEFVAGYVGRLSLEKGVHHLMEAGRILKEDGRKFRMIIVGDGPQKGTLEKQAKELGLGREIVFAGFQSEIEKWLSALDLFVLPSLTEGTPMALLEAMSFGIPVIATRVGGVPKVIKDGISGILTNPGDSLDLSEKLSFLLRNPSLRDRLSEKARYTISRQYNVHDWCRRIESEYVELLPKASPI